MESAVADEIVRRECGLLSHQQRAVLGYRTMKGVVHAEESLLETEVPGVAEAVAKSLKGKDPLQGMLALRRSAIQLRTATMFDPVKLVAPADYAFSTQFPVQKLLMILENQMITALPGMNANMIVDEFIENMMLELDEEQTKELAKTGDIGNPFLNKILAAKNRAIARGDSDETIAELDTLLAEAKDFQDRHTYTEKVLVEREGMVEEELGQAEDALGTAQKQAKQTEVDPKYHNQIVGAGITKLAESYKHRIGTLHGYHTSPQRTRDMKAAGLIAPSAFRQTKTNQSKQGTLTREEQYAMFKRAWGDHRMGAITSLNLVAEGGTVDMSDETPQIQELAADIEEQTHTMPDGTEMSGEAHY